MSSWQITLCKLLKQMVWAQYPIMNYKESSSIQVEKIEKKQTARDGERIDQLRKNLISFKKRNNISAYSRGEEITCY